MLVKTDAASLFHNYVNGGVPSVCSEFVIVFSKRCVCCTALWKEQKLIL